MREFTVTDLARTINAQIQQNAGGRSPHAAPTRCLTGVSIDSRTIKAGECFFAIPGDNFNGHDYIADAFAKGAACAVVSQTADDDKYAANCLLRVRDTVQALGDFARDYRLRAAFKVVAITGSVGKTTTRQIVHHALSSRFRVHQSPRSFNNNIGLPLTLLGADPTDRIVIAELGGNHPGEIAHLTRIALPDIAVVTNVHEAHLQGFGDLENIVREKISIGEALRPGGVLIVNGDFPQLAAACRARGFSFRTFGKSGRCDYRADNIVSDGLTGRCTIDGIQITLPLAGSGNIDNALAAWAVCSRLGLTIADFAATVRTLSPLAMRAEPMQVGTLTVINDCYNANPASMRNALDILASLAAANRRLVLVCGDMAELGDRAEALHAALAPHILRAGVKLVLAAGRLAKLAAETAKNTAQYDLQIKCFEDTPSACNSLHKFIKDYDIILVKGSRAAGLEMVVEKLKDLFQRGRKDTRLANQAPRDTG
ncbi:MAG: UDP-N-acetylmuramoyl-tripeptide--D-alanyl-D-alanine ligase [Phycisphaerales bacterium]|nr:MAG: UDP-N-acetylmuramoyl-tripeptide--D-alanyl-D-alanine ligase [Phycisphaerales bacterium]